MTLATGDNRRRHARLARDVGDVLLERAGQRAVVAAADVRDVGVGGCFLCLAQPPRLHDEVVVTLAGFTLAGRVVRVQLGGRERGAVVGKGVAIAFHGVDEGTLGALAALLAPRDS